VHNILSMGKRELPEILSTEEVAELLGLDASMVRRYAAKKKLPGKRVGKRSWVFLRSDVLAFSPRKVGRPPKLKDGGKP
jgi:excisionase family DNA binding protein